jgi:phage-related protein
MMYVVSLKKALYVLHAFMKKSKSAIGLPKPDGVDCGTLTAGAGVG